jgi:hypothetical protein
MEPLKIIQVGRIENNELIIFESHLKKEVLFQLASLNHQVDGFLKEAFEQKKSLSFKYSVQIGESEAARIVQLDGEFPLLAEISRSQEIHNILEYFSFYIFSIADLTDNLRGSETSVPHSGFLQRFWCFKDRLVWVNRPSRSSADYEFISLKVEEFFFETEDEFLRLKHKVERLRNLKENRKSATRGYIADDVLAYVLVRDEEKCVKCSSKQSLQFDHILPISRGGSDEPDNLRVLCRSCNLARGNLANQ